jgi:hypothetical protein
VDVVDVALGDAAAAVRLPALGGSVGAPDPVVVDEVHHAEPPRVRVPVAVRVGREQPGQDVICLSPLNTVV